MDFMDTYGHLVTVNVVGCSALGRHLTVLNKESRRRSGRRSFKFRDQIEEGINFGRKTIGKKMKLLYENRSYKYLYIRLSWQFLLFIITLNIFAAIYQAFEHTHEEEVGVKTRTTKDIVQNFSRTHNISENAIEKLFEDWEREGETGGERMTYMEAIILTLSVFYTIGWGQVIPRSTGGKLFCILSSCIGIPITFVMIITGAKIFQRHMHDFIQLVFGGGCKRKCAMESNDCKLHKSAKILLLTFVSVLFTYMLTTAGIVMAFEGSSYIDSLYYCFQSLSTIGVGNIIQHQLKKEQDDGKSFALTTFLFFWILFGIIMVAANLLTFLNIKKEELFSIPEMVSNFFSRREENSTACLVENQHNGHVEAL